MQRTCYQKNELVIIDNFQEDDINRHIRTPTPTTQNLRSRCSIYFLRESRFTEFRVCFDDILYFPPRTNSQKGNIYHIIGGGGGPKHTGSEVCLLLWSASPLFAKDVGSLAEMQTPFLWGEGFFALRFRCVQARLLWMRLFYLQLRYFYLQFVVFTYRAATVSKRDQIQFPDGGER